MELKQISPDSYEFSDRDRRLTRLVRLFLSAIVIIVLVNALVTGAAWPVAVVLVVAAGFWKLADYVDVDSHAVFDRAANSFHIVQTRRGKPVLDRREPLDRIEAVVIAADSRSSASDNTVKTRPVVVIDGLSVPLTFASFKAGPAATDIAERLREFLGSPATDLIEDSIRQALRGPAGVGPAVRLARLGKGLGRLEAAAYVRTIEEGIDGLSRSGKSVHSIRRERS
ncbi:MAG TPA: hypothetical protein VK862_16175 [Afifellaceae bacterium]|nr:hypothetical protein [Afifellaceae bacterium]